MALFCCIVGLLVGELGALAAASPVVPSTISAGSAHTCGVRTDGTLACWGTNDFGRAPPGDNLEAPPPDR